jgi:uncharacterized C2H2 Zn-finger protein
MPINDDGDVIRACGFMAIYFGNLEEELGDLFDVAAQSCSILRGKSHLGFKDRARHLRKHLSRQFTPEWPSRYDKARIRCVLGECMKLADKRNEILHSSIIGGRNGEAILRCRRNGERILTFVEVDALAKKVSAYCGHIYGLQLLLNRMPT